MSRAQTLTTLLAEFGLDSNSETEQEVPELAEDSTELLDEFLGDEPSTDPDDLLAEFGLDSNSEAEQEVPELGIGEHGAVG